MSKYIGYIASVTEYESGWGQRPDGYIVCLDKQSGINFATRENGKVWCSGDGSEFSIANDFKICILTEMGYDRLVELEHQRLWIQNSEYNKFVKED